MGGIIPLIIVFVTESTLHSAWIEFVLQYESIQS
jgi:hypothetical protein